MRLTLLLQLLLGAAAVSVGTLSAADVDSAATADPIMRACKADSDCVFKSTDGSPCFGRVAHCQLPATSSKVVLKGVPNSVLGAACALTPPNGKCPGAGATPQTPVKCNNGKPSHWC